MGQSLLIDMNSGWYKHKTEVNDGLKTMNYNQVLGALDSLNALLPDEYRVVIDSDDYNEKIKGNLLAMCPSCVTDYPDPNDRTKVLTLPTQTEHTRLKKLRLLLPKMDQIARGKKYNDYWECPKCFTLNDLSKTRFKQRILKKPFYLQVVPDPPKRHLGIEDRGTYHIKFAGWARLFLAELNASAQRFRQEYKPKDDADGSESEFSIKDDDDLD